MMKSDELKNVIPDTPPFISRLVKDEVAKQLEQAEGAESLWKRSASGSIFKKKRVLVLLAAALLAAAAVSAGTSHGLTELFRSAFGTQEARELIETSVPVTVTGQVHMPAAYSEEGTEEIFWNRPIMENAAAVLDLTEIQFDGRSLYVYGTATENGRQYTLGGDRIYVDGQEAAAGLDTADDGRTYALSADLSAFELQEDFEVILPVAVYKGDVRYQNQELCFTVHPAAAPDMYANRTFVHEEYEIEVRELTRSSSAFSLRITYEMKEEARKRYEDQGQSLYPMLRFEDRILYPERVEELHEGSGPDLRFTIPEALPDKAALMLCTVLPDEEGSVTGGELLSEDLLELW